MAARFIACLPWSASEDGHPVGPTERFPSSSAVALVPIHPSAPKLGVVPPSSSEPEIHRPAYPERPHGGSSHPSHYFALSMFVKKFRTQILVTSLRPSEDTGCVAFDHCGPNRQPNRDSRCPARRGDPHGDDEEMGGETGSHPRVAELARPPQSLRPKSARSGIACRRRYNSERPHSQPRPGPRVAPWGRPGAVVNVIGPVRLSQQKNKKTKVTSPNSWEVAEMVHKDSIPALQSTRGSALPTTAGPRDADPRA